jgi:hypothetical protein
VLGLSLAKIFQNLAPVRVIEQRHQVIYCPVKRLGHVDVDFSEQSAQEWIGFRQVVPSGERVVGSTRQSTESRINVYAAVRPLSTASVIPAICPLFAGLAGKE